MSEFLESMCSASRHRCRQAQLTHAVETVVARARAAPPPPSLKFHPDGFDVIAEVKRASPALGELSTETDVQLIDRALAYAHAGAAAVSVLTEPNRFKGQLEHLVSISDALRPLGVPVMRKDFLVDVYQIWEAAAAGAGGVLLILRTLDDATVLRMLEAAEQTRMFVLLEAFDERDLLRAHPLVKTHPHVLVGLNSRNLATLEVDPARLLDLVGQFPADCMAVAESGIKSPEDAEKMRRAGYRLALVGTALMQQPRPTRLITAMLRQARKAA